ncbi:MAG: flagellar hook assembly protein FlgD [Rhodobacteraceae bacterium]|jgi:flagellar basal-body rod modification protein FlgD|nr:flagellar hook assembly protein FlgD [Paracoccaceae bacterium]
MEITQTSTQTGAALARTAAASTAAEGAAAGSALSSDFQTFLLMLTEQLKNQDPLNPLEATDFAVQLATFSGVEQQVRTNDLLRDLAGQMGTGSLAQYAGWIGMDAKTPAPVYFGGQPVVIDPQRANGATSSTLVVRDSTGAIVGQAVLPQTSGPVEWVPADSDGMPLPAGLYRLTVENRNGETTLPETAVLSYARVSEVRAGTDGPEIVLQGGAIAKPADVAGLREG